MKKVRRSKLGFIRRMEKEAFAGLLGVSMIMLTTGFTDKDVQNVTVEVDGRIVEAHTANFSPDNIFDTIGIELKDNDEYIVIKNDNDIKIRVLRAIPVSVKVEDAGATYYTTATEKVSDFLKSSGYDMNRYEANVPLDSKITENMQIVLEDKEAKIARAKAAEEEARKHSVQTSRGQQRYTNVMTMEATAYLANYGGCGSTTATGLPAKRGVVAVDPRVIPLGTRVYVEGYGEAIAADTGGAIKGNKIDLCVNSYAEACQIGRKNVTVYILE